MEAQDLRRVVDARDAEAGRADRLASELASAEAERDEARAAKDGAYRERDQVVALLARMALALGWRAGLRSHEPDPDPTWDDDWKNVVAIDLPTGQVTWHFHDSERHLFHSLPAYPRQWDGHDTAEKYRRVNLAAPAAAEAEVRRLSGELAAVDDALDEFSPGHQGGTLAEAVTMMRAESTRRLAEVRRLRDGLERLAAEWEREIGAGRKTNRRQDGIAWNHRTSGGRRCAIVERCLGELRAAMLGEDGETR